jgi:PAS domain S-box-containing protein
MASSSETGTPVGARLVASSFGVRSLLALAGVLLLYLTNPSNFTGFPGLWAPSAGLGLVLVAWWGPRAGLLLIGAGLLAVLQTVFVSVAYSGRVDATPLSMSIGDALLETAEVLAAWWLYRRLGGGARTLNDPQSAVLFVLLVPGLTAALFAAARSLWDGALLGELSFFSQRLVQWQLSRALGFLAVAPPLLTAATPWLVRRGLVRPEATTPRQSADRGHAGAEPLARGDAVEVAGLALGSGLFALLLAWTYGRHDLEGWQPWGAPLLLIVWASLRQGQRGGVLTAGVAAALPLSVLASFPGGINGRDTLLIQGNLLALSGAGLLAAAAAGWVRTSETRYRQMVTHVPVVVYSGRLLPGPRGRFHAEVTLVSAASGALLGCPPEQLLGDHERWLQRVHPEDREVVLAAIAQLSRQKQPVTCDYRLAPLAPPEAKVDISLPNSPIRALTPLPARWVRDVLAPRFDAEGRLCGWEGVVADVTEQRALAVDLRRTSGMFHALVANLPAGVFFIQGPVGRPILVNNRARELLGRREDASAGLEHFAEYYRLFRSDGSPYPVEELGIFHALHRGVAGVRDDIVVHRPDGRRVPLITWSAPVRLGGPVQADGAVWVLEDLTALHQAEAARRDSEGQLRAVVEAIAEGLVVHDRKRMVVDCNAAACAIFHRTPEQLRGGPLLADGWDCLSEDGALLPHEEQPVQKVLRTGRPMRNFVLGLRPQTTGACATGQDVRWFLVNAMQLPGAAGTAGVVTTFSDMTAIRRAQEILRISEEKYRGLIESLPLMVVQSDREMRLEYANPAVRAVTGFEMDEVADPAAWAARVAPDDLPRLHMMAAEALNGQAGRAEYRYCAKDGSLKTAFALAQPRWQDGAVVGVTTLMVDMTRERQLEHDLQRAQRLELIGRLSSGIVHDFNNLLTLVLSLTDIAHGSLPPDHPVHEDLNRITEAGEKAASLAGQLLTFSKQQRASAGRSDINRAARRTLDLLRGVLPSAVRTEVSLADGELFVPLDETQLQQVLMNLCLNARDAMPNGGGLSIHTEAALVAEEAEAAPSVRLSVADEGCGMSDEIKAQIFDPFYSTKDRGTGLGLAVVRQIVEGCGGRVDVHTELGRGSRFDVWLPAQHSTAAATV